MGPFEPTKTREPGTKSAAAAPGKSAASGACSATVSVAGGLDEPAELGVSDWVLVHPEIADCNLMDWAFFRVEVPAPHAKLPTGDKHHSLRRRFHDVRPPSDDISQGSLLPTSTTFCRAWHTAAAGWILGGRNIVDAFLQAQSREPTGGHMVDAAQEVMADFMLRKADSSTGDSNTPAR